MLGAVFAAFFNERISNLSLAPTPQFSISPLHYYEQILSCDCKRRKSDADAIHPCFGLQISAYYLVPHPVPIFHRRQLGIPRVRNKRAPNVLNRQLCGSIEQGYCTTAHTFFWVWLQEGRGYVANTQKCKNDMMWEEDFCL